MRAVRCGEAVVSLRGRWQCRKTSGGSVPCQAVPAVRGTDGGGLMANRHKLGTGHRKHFPSRTQTCHSAPVKAKQWLRRYEAMTWRARGLNFAEIGQKMGVSRQKATDLVYGGFNEVAPTETLDKVRREEAHRLELLQRVYFPKAEAGDVDCANLCLKISK